MSGNFVEIRVKATDTAKPDLADLKARLDELAHKVATARVDVADKDAAAKLTGLNARLAAIGKRIANPRIDLAGAASAEAQIAGVDAALSHLGERSAGAGGARAGKSFASRFLAQLGGIAPGAGIAAGGLGALSMAGPLAAGALGLAAFAAVALPSLDKVKKALTTTGTAGAKAWAQLNPAQVGLARDVQQLEGQFGRVQAAMAPVVARVVDLAVKVGGALMPALTQLAPVGAKILTGFLTPLLQLLRSDFFGGFIRQMTGLATSVAPMLGKSLVQLLRAFLDLFQRAGPAGASMLTGLVRLLVLFVQNITPAIVLVSGIIAVIGRWAGANRLAAASLVAVGVALLLATGGWSAVVPAILAVIAAITYFWRTSRTFRDGITAVWTFIAHVILYNAGFILQMIQRVGDALFSFVGNFVHVNREIANAMGLHFLDGIDNGLSKARASFDKFFSSARDKVSSWDKFVTSQLSVMRLKGDITDLQSKIATAEKLLSDKRLSATQRARIEADISQLQQKLAQARAALQSLQGYTVNTFVNTVPGPVRGHESGGVTGASSGGYRSRLTMVGEHGPELVDLAPGSYVNSNPDTERILSGRSGGEQVVRVVLEVRGGDAGLRNWLKGQIRTHGGDPEVLGR